MPSLGAGGQAEADHQARSEAGEGEGSDWASVASFPIHDEVKHKLNNNQLRTKSDMETLLGGCKQWRG